MHKKSVTIPNINCGHCVQTIETELSALDHIISVKAEEATKIVEIAWNDPQTWLNIQSLLKEINYPVRKD
jgi:copper chaperone CopZ